ncbi:hypothetical protein ZEAMMB73_Zm00001d009346 [Zea mays]|uniref:Uncharacterized protein n=1 Tax=Zea mays TaxID=4577 RepID=A0A1D6FJ00_MAIZE|nr:hypothetical protein ZEAMMB73_Zm00001d009346 [Zea mays]
MLPSCAALLLSLLRALERPALCSPRSLARSMVRSRVLELGFELHLPASRLLFPRVLPAMARFDLCSSGAVESLRARSFLLNGAPPCAQPSPFIAPSRSPFSSAPCSSAPAHRAARPSSFPASMAAAHLPLLGSLSCTYPAMVSSSPDADRCPCRAPCALGPAISMALGRVFLSHSEFLAATVVQWLAGAVSAPLGLLMLVLVSKLVWPRSRQTVKLPRCAL